MGTRHPLGDIRPTAVQQWFSDLGRGTTDVKPVGASVVRRAHYVFSSILADAVRDNLIARNPAAGVKLPSTTRKRPRERGDLLFPGDDGGHLKRPRPTSGWFAKAVAESGIPRATAHDLAMREIALRVVTRMRLQPWVQSRT